MSEAALVAALGALVGGRVYPDVAPAGAATPFCTFQQVGGSPVNFMGAESSSKKSARIQINVWSTKREESITLIRQIEDIVVASPLYASIEGGAVALYDEATKLRGAMQDFHFWM